MPKHKLICKNCGKEFENYFENQKYCCRDCMNKYRRSHGILKEKTCPICGKTFHPSVKTQIYCSNECKYVAFSKRVTLTCDYCGKEFTKAPYEIKYGTHRNYCSKECKNNARNWSQEDIAILKEYYGIEKNEDIAKRLNSKRSAKAVRSKASAMKLGTPREWSEEETKILLEYYPSVPLKEVQGLLPDRTLSSILGKARTCNITSFFYNNHVYNESEDEYLKANYLDKTDKELGEHLGRSPVGISQHLWHMGLYRPKEEKKYGDLSQFLRGRMLPWGHMKKRETNYTCELTGQKGNVVVHHIRGFNLILEEVISALDFPLYDNFNDYTEKQLVELTEKFYEIHDYYSDYIIISESIHKLFHSRYGYGNNTREQWDEFIDSLEIGKLVS